MKNKLIIFFLFFSPFVAFSQYIMYDDYLYSLNKQPASTRAEAMGYAGVASGGTMQETRINPASLAVSDYKLMTEFSNSSPVFFDPRSNFVFLGAGGKVSKKISLGYSEFRCKIFSPALGFNHGSNAMLPNWIKENHHVLNASVKLPKGFAVGINATMFDNNIDSSGDFHSFFVDLGIMWDKDLNRHKQKNAVSSRLRLGASMTNVNFANAYFQFPNGVKDTTTIMSYLRTGASYFYSLNVSNIVYGKASLIPVSARTIDILIQTQYIHFFNTVLKSEKHNGQGQAIMFWGVNTGVEISILKVLIFRMGYRYEKRLGSSDMTSPVVSYPYLKGFTYGGGINIPFHNLQSRNIPFDLAIDFCHQKQFQLFKPYSPFQTVPTSSVSVRLNWFINKK